MLKRVAVLQKEAGRVKSFVKIREPGIQAPVNRQTFVCTFDRAAWKASLERDGSTDEMICELCPRGERRDICCGRPTYPHSRHSFTRTAQNP
jgi:hypothetical protein